MGTQSGSALLRHTLQALSRNFKCDDPRSLDAILKVIEGGLHRLLDETTVLSPTGRDGVSFVHRLCYRLQAHLSLYGGNPVPTAESISHELDLHSSDTLVGWVVDKLHVLGRHIPELSSPVISKHGIRSDCHRLLDLIVLVMDLLLFLEGHLVHAYSKHALCESLVEGYGTDAFAFGVLRVGQFSPGSVGGYDVTHRLPALAEGHDWVTDLTTVKSELIAARFDGEKDGRKLFGRVYTRLLNGLRELVNMKHSLASDDKDTNEYLVVLESVSRNLLEKYDTYFGKFTFLIRGTMSERDAMSAVMGHVDITGSGLQVPLCSIRFAGEGTTAVEGVQRDVNRWLAGRDETVSFRGVFVGRGSDDTCRDLCTAFVSPGKLIQDAITKAINNQCIDVKDFTMIPEPRATLMNLSHGGGYGSGSGSPFHSGGRSVAIGHCLRELCRHDFGTIKLSDVRIKLVLVVPNAKEFISCGRCIEEAEAESCSLS